MKFLADEAEICERFNQLKKYRKAMNPANHGKRPVPRNPEPKNGSPTGKGRLNEADHPKTLAEAPVRPVNGTPPLFLVKGWNLNHFVREHPRISKEGAKKLVEDSGADMEVISDNIIEFLSNKVVFFPQ